MLKFLLIIMLAGPTGADVVHVQPFPTMAACEKVLKEAVAAVPIDAQINSVAVCARVRNATEQEV